LKIQKLDGWINMACELRFEGEIKTATISQDAAGDWYISIAVDVEPPEHKHERESTGVDLGINFLATLSDGQRERKPKTSAVRTAKAKKVEPRTLSKETWRQAVAQDKEKVGSSLSAHSSPKAGLHPQDDNRNSADVPSYWNGEFKQCGNGQKSSPSSFHQ
jgi:transposase